MLALSLYTNLKAYLNPEEPTFFEDLQKEIIIGNPKKVGSSGFRACPTPKV